jgi:hypothetical protein
MFGSMSGSMCNQRTREGLGGLTGGLDRSVARPKQLLGLVFSVRMMRRGWPVVEPVDHT